jgi:hypothetical protein
LKMFLGVKRNHFQINQSSNFQIEQTSQPFPPDFMLIIVTLQSFSRLSGRLY